MINKIPRAELLQASGFDCYDLVGVILGESLTGKTVSELEAEGISEALLRVLNLRGFCNEVCSGGVIQFFAWSRAEDVAYVIESLRLIGLEELANLVEFGVPLAIESQLMFESGQDFEPFGNLRRAKMYDNLETDFWKVNELVEDDAFYYHFAEYVKSNVEHFTE